MKRIYFLILSLFAINSFAQCPDLLGLTETFNETNQACQGNDVTYKFIKTTLNSAFYNSYSFNK